MPIHTRSSLKEKTQLVFQLPPTRLNPLVFSFNSLFIKTIPLRTPDPKYKIVVKIRLAPEINQFAVHHVNPGIDIFEWPFDAELDFSVADAFYMSCDAAVGVFIEPRIFCQIFVEAFFVFFLRCVG